MIGNECEGEEMNEKRIISKSDKWLWGIFSVGILFVAGWVLNYTISLSAMFTDEGEAVNISKPIAITSIVLFFYLIPTILGRKKRKAAKIAVLNLFLGWTVIGWIVALVFASTKDRD